MFTTTIRGSRAARATVLPLLATAALGLTACGGGDDTASMPAAATTANGGAQQQGGYGQGGRGGFGAQTEEERAKLQACLKKEGVTLPTGRGGQGGGPGDAPPTRTDGAPPAGADGAPPADGAGGPPGGGLPGGGGGRTGGPAGGGGAGMSTADREKLQAALKTCGVTAPADGAGRRPGRPDVSSAAYRKSIEAYVACVKKNGFDLPKPDFSGDGPIFDPGEVDQDDATFKKASEACQSTLRQGRGTGGNGASGSGSGSGTTTSSGATT